MNDARRFLRYITPGILFGVLTLFLAWLVIPGWTISVLKTWLFAPDNSAAILIGSLLASGTLGYLFATIHHCCHWYLPIDKNVINHTEQIKTLREKGLISQPADTFTNPRLEALITMSVLWFERLEAGKPIGNSENRVAAFSDLTHAAGTARVASVFALLAAILIGACYGSWNPSVPNVIHYVAMVVIGIAISWLFHDAYRRTGGISQQLYDRILEHALMMERNNEQEGNAT